MLELKKNPKFEGVEPPLLLVIMDGVGIYRGIKDGYCGNALDIAFTPNFDKLFYGHKLSRTIKAHGRAVGLPSDKDMGNSEVGHNALGAGRIFDQGAMLVNRAIETRALFEGKVWMEDIGTPQAPGHILRTWNEARKENPELAPADAPNAVHFIGLLSDGNVHSHINHLFAMIDECARVGVPKLFVHALLDGRDVDERSAHVYIQQLEEKLESIEAKHGFFYRIASGGGRMVITMDRYEANWNMVELGWKTHVAGEGRKFASALEAIETLRNENPGIIDQDLPPFVISSPRDATEPIGPITDDDVVIFFNFRGDRAIEISRAFTEPDFDKFERIPNPQVHYSGMMEYDGDLHIPPRYLVEPPHIDRTISEYLSAAGVPTLAISETQKFGHVTYFWNGNNSEPFDDKLETWIEIPSDVIPFEFAPAMKANEVCDRLISELKTGKYTFARVNFANGDMVGHTGMLGAAVEAMNTVDRCLGRLLDTIDALGGTMILLADHGNCDQMFELNKDGSVKLKPNGEPQAKTSHTLSPVPFVVHTPKEDRLELADVKDAGLANVAATILFLLGFVPPDIYEPSLLKLAD